MLALTIVTAVLALLLWLSLLGHRAMERDARRNQVANQLARIDEIAAAAAARRVSDSQRLRDAVDGLPARHRRPARVARPAGPPASVRLRGGPGMRRENGFVFAAWTGVALFLLLLFAPPAKALPLPPIPNPVAGVGSRASWRACSTAPSTVGSAEPASPDHPNPERPQP